MKKRIRFITQGAPGITVFLVLNAGGASSVLGHDIGFVHRHVESSLHQNVWLGAGIAVFSATAVVLGAWMDRKKKAVAAKNLA